MIIKAFTYAVAVMLLFSVYSCTKKEDDLASQDCPANCTVITGRFLTDARQTGIGGIPLIVEWVKNTSPYSVQVRRKATTFTNADGWYELRFLMRDDELTDGYFKILYSADSKRFVVDRSSVGYTAYNLTRDTIIVSDWLLPRKAFLRLELAGPLPTAPNDYFASTVSFDNGPLAPAGYYGIVNTWSNNATSFNIEVAANQNVIIENRRVKNGIRVIDTATVQLAPGSKTTYSTSF